MKVSASCLPHPTLPLPYPYPTPTLPLPYSMQLLLYPTLPYPTLPYSTLLLRYLTLPNPTYPTLHYTTLHYQHYPKASPLPAPLQYKALPRVYWGVQGAARLCEQRPAHPSDSGRAHNILGTFFSFLYCFRSPVQKSIPVPAFPVLCVSSLQLPAA